MARVYIGVGHGGSDPGAVYGTFRESELALDIATACTNELRRHGVEVRQSRTDDSYQSAADKIRDCNAYAPDAALDIHLNSGGGDGFEIFCSIAGGKGKTLAQSIERAVIAIGQNSRGIKTRKNSQGRDYFGFIRQTDCPAVLVECAFLDSGDAESVDTPEKRQTMGKAVARGVLTHLQVALLPEEDEQPESENVIVTLPLLSRSTAAPEYQVERVQLCLNQMGWTGADNKPLAVDGIYGAATESAVRKLQAAHGIEPDGRMTARTWRALLVFYR